MRAWSARLYRHLIDGGDVNADGRVMVLVLSEDDDRPWLPEYFVWLGADVAIVRTVPTREAAEDTGLIEAVANADAVFIKGGDQGQYYDLWQGTALHTAVTDLAARGGGIGGTSAGAMSLASIALAGGRDYVTPDVLADACTPFLDDADGGSALKTDFFALVPALIDTHFVERARLGRMTGALARAVADGLDPAPIGLGLDAQTGVWFPGDTPDMESAETAPWPAIGTVVGDGSVTVVRTATAAAPLRPCGAPLGWAGLEMDRLIDGMEVDLSAGGVVRASGGPTTLSPPALSLLRTPDTESTPWLLTAADPDAEEGFGQVIVREPYALRPGTAPLRLDGATGVLAAHDPDHRALNDEALFQSLASGGFALGVIADGDGQIGGDESGLLLVETGSTPQSALLLRVPAGAQGSVGPGASPHGGTGLHPSALLGATLHVLSAEVPYSIE